MDEIQVLENWFKLIATGKYCEEREHMIKVAEFWNKIYNALSQFEIIKKYRPNESGAQQEQRQRLTSSHTRYVVSKIDTQFRHVDRCDSITDILHYETDSTAENKNLSDLNYLLTHYQGDEGISEYNDKNVLKYSMKDPNAFFITSFDSNFDGTVERPRPVPMIVTSEKVRTFQKDNGVLKYLAFDSYKKVGRKKQGIHILYTETRHYRLTEVVDGVDTTGKETIYLDQFRESNVRNEMQWELILTNSASGKGKQYIFEEFNPLMDFVPAIQPGWVESDEYGDFIIYESCLLPAKELFVELINKKSTYDVHMALHGIAKQIAYIPRCNYVGENQQVCQNGIVDGHECPKCSGTGKMPIHRSEQDILTIEIPMTLDETTVDANLIDAQKLHQYLEIPKHIIEGHKVDCADIKRDISLAMFNKDVINDPAVVNVAAEAIIANNQAVYNRFYEYANHRVKVRRLQIKSVATYADLIKGLVYDRKYPSDYRIEHVVELLTQLKLSNEAGASSAIQRSINVAIMKKQNIDNPDHLLYLVAKERLRPFYDLTKEERLSAITMLSISDPKRSSYIYFDDIINELDTGENPDWYRRSLGDQIQLFNTIRDRYHEAAMNARQSQSPAPVLDGIVLN